MVLCYCLPLLNYPLFFDYLLQTRTTKTNNSQENSQVTSSMYFVFFVSRISTHQQSRTPNQPININQPLFDLLWERWICMTPTDTFLTLSCWEESGRFTIHNIHLPMLVHQPFRRTNAEAQGRRCRFTDHNICVYIYTYYITMTDTTQQSRVKPIVSSCDEKVFWVVRAGYKVSLCQRETM